MIRDQVSDRAKTIPGEWDSRGMRSLRASVVVPTYRRPALLDRCLAALVAQDLDPDTCPYEIIVVDDAGCDETRRQVECWAARAPAPVPLHYLLTKERHGPAAARNLGWQAARGEIIAFTDDDCIPAPDWLRAGLAAFVDGPEQVAGASGRVVVPLPSAPTDYQLNAAQIEGAEFITANCFYRRAALAAIGGLDERFEMAWREDSDLHFNLEGRGARLVRVPEAVAVHPLRPAGWGISLGQQRKSMYNALLYKKHPRLYRERIQAAPPWHYYMTVAALLTALGGLVGRQRLLVRGSGAVWLALTARFCARRLRGTSRRPGHLAEMIVTSALIPPLAVFWRLRGALKFRVWFL